MKLLKTVLTAALSIVILGSQVLAADPVDSPVRGDGPKIISAITASGEDITDNMVSTRMGTTSSIDKINASLSGARADITAAGENPKALPGIGDALGEGDYKFAEVFDVTYVKDGVAASTGTVTLAFEYSAPSGKTLKVLHKGGSWEVLDASISGNTVTVTVGSTSPFAFVVAPSSSAPAKADGETGTGTTTTTSPQTGEYVTKYILLAAAALMVAGVVCVKRAKKSSAK